MNAYIYMNIYIWHGYSKLATPTVRGHFGTFCRTPTK